MPGEFPAAPVVGVGAVIVKDGRVVIVKRRFAPRQGDWSLPGGRVHLGEPLVDALRREIREETSLEIAIGPIVEVVDRIHRDGDRVQYHFVIVDYLCICTGGELCAGDDAEDAAWVLPHQLSEYGVNAFARTVVDKALEAADEGARSIAWK
jgi:8-oxo-dGTP diphosphatase